MPRSEPRSPRDALRIVLHEQGDVRYWCRKLHCTEHQLREAVDQVGPMPSNVEAYLRQRASDLGNIEIPPGGKLS